jgi:hypothetical protein
MLIRRPFLELACVEALLDLDANQVAYLVEDGSLLHVVNIAARKSRRRCLRILSSSFMDYVEKRPPSKLSMNALLETVFTPGLTLELASVARMLSASSELLHDLVADKSIRLLPGQKVRRGREGSPLLDRAVLISWLASREVY